MFDMIRETQAKFKELVLLMDSADSKNSDYYATLCELTQQAYVAMSQGMCESTEVCHECAKHRDFLHAMIPILEDLKEGAPLSDEYARLLEEYGAITKEVLSRISSILSAL